MRNSSSFRSNATSASSAAVARNDLEAASDGLHPEIEFHTYANAPAAGVYRGRDAVRRYNEDLFAQFESVRLEVDEVVDAGQRVVVMSTQHAVPKGGRQEISVQLAEVWTIRDGRLAEHVPTPRERRPWKPPGGSTSGAGAI